LLPFCGTNFLLSLLYSLASSDFFHLWKLHIRGTHSSSYITLSKRILLLRPSSIMANSPVLPSHFTYPFITTIQGSRYDTRGRQMHFIESEVQRLERLAFAKASKSCSSSPTGSFTSSSSGSPVSPACLHVPLRVNHISALDAANGQATHLRTIQRPHRARREPTRERTLWSGRLLRILRWRPLLHPSRRCSQAIFTPQKVTHSKEERPISDPRRRLEIFSLAFLRPAYDSHGVTSTPAAQISVPFWSRIHSGLDRMPRFRQR
jgi:hypothetical protein